MKVERPRARSSAAPTRENSRSTMPSRARDAGTIAADLRQQRDQRVLAQEGRFTGHVRAGDQPELAGLLRRRRREIAGIGDEGLAVALQRLLDHRMPAALDRKAERAVDVGPYIIVVNRKFGQRGRDVEHRERMRGGPQIVAGARAPLR